MCAGGFGAALWSEVDKLDDWVTIDDVARLRLTPPPASSLLPPGVDPADLPTGWPHVMGSSWSDLHRHLAEAKWP
jgi:hypothetical protein